MVIVLCAIFAIIFGKNLFHPSSESESFAGNDTVSQEEFAKDNTDGLDYNNETTDWDTEEGEICDDESYNAKLQVYKRQNIGDPVLNCMRTAQKYTV